MRRRCKANGLIRELELGKRRFAYQQDPTSPICTPAVASGAPFATNHITQSGFTALQPTRLHMRAPALTAKALLIPAHVATQHRWQADKHWCYAWSLHLWMLQLPGSMPQGSFACGNNTGGHPYTQTQGSPHWERGWRPGKCPRDASRTRYYVLPHLCSTSKSSCSSQGQTTTQIIKREIFIYTHSEASEDCSSAALGTRYSVVPLLLCCSPIQ